MRNGILALALLASFGCCAQSDLPPAPTVEAINLRLDMASVQMRKAAWSRETSIYWALAGGLFTVVASDRSAKAYSQDLAVGIGAATAAGVAIFQLKGARHDKRHAAALHGQ